MTQQKHLKALIRARMSRTEPRRGVAADADDPAAVIDALPKGVYSLDFSPDGRLLAQCGADGMARVWSVRNGTR